MKYLLPGYATRCFNGPSLLEMMTLGVTLERVLAEQNVCLDTIEVIVLANAMWHDGKYILAGLDTSEEGKHDLYITEYVKSRLREINFGNVETRTAASMSSAVRDYFHATEMARQLNSAKPPEF